MKCCWSVSSHQGPVLHLIRLVSKIEPFTRTATTPTVGGEQRLNECIFLGYYKGFATILKLLNNDISVFFCVKFTVCLRSMLKYNILNMWFGYKKYLSSEWRVCSVVDKCLCCCFQTTVTEDKEGGSMSQQRPRKQLTEVVSWQKDLSIMWTTSLFFQSSAHILFWFQELTLTFGAYPLFLFFIPWHI